MEEVTVMLAFVGGLLAFISPCCLPLYPSFLSYITGVSVSELKGDNGGFNRKKVLLHSILFSIGFSIIYYVLGFSVSSASSIFVKYKDLVRMLGGIFITLMGLFLMGVIQPKFMMREFRFKQKKRGANYLNSLLVGFIFAAGWTPCIGPIFGAIMYATALNPAQTFMNITAYSMGFCIPFILMAFFISKTRFLLKYSDMLMKIGGTIMVVLGIMLYFNKLVYINVWFSQFQYRFYEWFGL
ncbi:cytochrome c biogenesis CcdA family protein [Guptibacillus hwajinpoensis]|uniref:cytochrome c biogenesis CcdA family protein n=1 Tax=Guptibacillus hwajinpoensis TaxID=208199 RepID=UPI001CFED612|nr:cytochrome c biogenesis protein CcdA [Pseudalkalibacillus hwajinpoensis]WLR58863.1 cytochrome c biogenesis protein CcdA [Pseudalkalibacillus hwajinpoensis]